MVARATKATKTAAEPIRISITALQKEAFELVLMGETPLIVNSWTQKGRLEMLKKHMQIPTIREAKDPQEQFLQSMYRLDDGEYGFPIVAVKEAMASATTDIEGIHKAQIYRNIFVKGREGFQVGAFCDIKSPMELAELFSPNPPRMREDVVRLAGIQKTPDLRYRAEFHPWALRLQVSYVRSFIAPEDIMNLCSKAGFTIGLAEWRQEKGGSNGLFHVADEHEKKQVARWIAAGHQEPKLIDVEAWKAKVRAEAQHLKQRDKGDDLAWIAESRHPDPAPRKRGPKGNGASAAA